MALFVFIATTPALGEDGQILDELYNQIMNTTLRERGVMDSGTSPGIPVDQVKVAPAADATTEKLRQEIEKYSEEAKQRHSDAVKFMREDR